MTAKSNGDRREVRVVIVGGSLVGLCTAIALARREARVTVPECTPQGRDEGGGGLGVDVRLLAAVTGLAERPPVCWGRDRATTAWPLLADWLEAHARRADRIDLRRGAEVVDTGDAWAQTVDGERYEGGVVIGADSARSTVQRVERSIAASANYLERASINEAQARKL